MHVAVVLRSAPHLATHEGLSVDTSVLLLSCFGLWVAIPPKLLEQRSTLLLTCSHCCVGRVPRGQWARVDSDTLVLIDRSACLVEPCACSVSPIAVLSLVPSRSSGTCSSLALRDLGLLLDDRLGSASSPLCS